MSDSENALKDLYEFADFAIDSDDDDNDNDKDGLDNIDIGIDLDLSMDDDDDNDISADDPLGVLMEKAKAAQKTNAGVNSKDATSTNVISGNVRTEKSPSLDALFGESKNESGADLSPQAPDTVKIGSVEVASTGLNSNANATSSTTTGVTTNNAPMISPSQSFTGATGTAASALKKKTVSVTEDPLSAFNASPTTSGKTHGVGVHTAAAASGLSNGLPLNGNTIPNLNHNVNPVTPYPQNASNPLAPQSANTNNNYTTSTDAAAAASQSVAKMVSSKTQSFTSTFSSFASKFSDAVSNAANSVPPVNMNMPVGGTLSNVGSVSTGSINSSVANASFAERSSLLPGRNVNTNMNAGPMGVGSAGVDGAAGRVPGPTVYGAGVQNGIGNSGVMEQVTSGQRMENSLKAAVLKSAVGDLLPGERVIKFFVNLKNVKETSSPHTGIGSSKLHNVGPHDPSKEEVWCCAMTLYRLILFSFRKTDFPVGAATGGTPASVNTNVNVPMNDAVAEEGQDIAKWEKSASISRQFQNVNNMQLVQKAGGKYHQVITMPMAAIDRVERTTDFTPSSSNLSFTGASIMGNNYNDNLGASAAKGTIVIHGKDNGRVIQFTTSSITDYSVLLKDLSKFAFTGRRNLGFLFAFESRKEEVIASTKKMDGVQGQGMTSNINAPGRVTARATPRRYVALSEFQRMVHISPDMPCPWRPFMKANATYNICQSYPSIIFGPSSINDETPEGMRIIRETAAFRSGQRFQSLSWASKYDGASLWRCAQPRVGLQGNRCTSDELYIKKLGECAAFANTRATANGKTPPRPSLDFLKMLTGGINESDLMLDSFNREGPSAINSKCIVKLFDLRPKSSAMANRTAGYGYENTSYYKNTTLSFFGIGNIHTVRDAYQKLSALCSNPSVNDVQWAQLVEETKWLSLTRHILSASWQAAFQVRYNRLPVLLHCSHGWDRTSQVCALAQIFLDPYYRTRAGFSCLVEKDFLALGHPLHLRSGHGEGRGERHNGNGSSGSQVDEGQMSPIFIQFLDCVFQIVNQYPDYFEFNTKYLLLISEHVYSCRFGTLLCDTEREREVIASIRQRTPCLWEYLDSSPGLVNRSYKTGVVKVDDSEESGTLLMPLSSLLRNVTLWVDRFCMHGAKPTARCLPSYTELNPVPIPSQAESVLFGAESLHEKALNNAQSNASRWQELAKQKDEEISELKRKLERYENVDQIHEEKQSPPPLM